MKSSDIKFRKHILIPLFIALLILLSGSIVNTYRLQQLDISRGVQAHLEEVRQITLAHLSGNSRELNDVLNLVKNDKGLQKGWLAHDRRDLLRRTEAVFKKLYTEQKITRLYFIDIMGVCFLRAHKPDAYGDTIDRYTLNKAMREAISTGGIELGPFGTLTLRVVHPWWIGGELTGYVEIGIDIDRLVPKLKKILNSELIFAVKKSYLVREKWEEGLKFVGRSGEWDRFPNYVIANKALDNISSRLTEHIQFHSSHLEENVFNLSTESKKYRIGFVPLVDAGGHKIGDIIVLKDITKKESALHIQLVTMVVGSAIIGAVLLGFFHFFVGRIERRLERSHNDLKHEIAERKQVEAALEQTRDKLEIRVQERTDDLKKANKQLLRELTERRKAEDEIRRLSQRLLSVIEEERKSLARDLHDEFGQALTILHLCVESLQSCLPEELSGQKTKCDELIEMITKQRDNLGKIVSELRPGMLDHLGFVPTLKWYIEDFVKKQDGLQIDFQATGVKKRPDPEIEITLYRILQEGLTNIARHSRAENVRITLTASHPNLIFVIKDDGIGFETIDEAFPLDARQAGVGLIGMRERVAAVGGTIDIHSNVGKGTTVRAELPVSRVKEKVADEYSDFR